MLKAVQINITCDKGSTGKICRSISKKLTERSIENHILYSHGASDYPLGIKYQKDHEVKLGALSSRLSGGYGTESKAATRRLVKYLEQLDPDVVHLHNLHGHNADLQILLPYLANKNKKVIWTFHDCWAFTGYCPHYSMVNCSKWQSGCGKCPQRKSYSWIFDRSEKLFKKKKDLITELDLTVITPSLWLSNEVKKSFLSKADIRVINNGIDLDVFKPYPSDFRKQYGLEDKYIVLGVAFDWGARKGLDVFIEMARKLPEKYTVVLVGTNDTVDASLPKNIISIHRTADQIELAKIYGAADVLANPTREENYPTVNMETLACGTPVVTFDTGGSPETLDEACGIVVPKNDSDKMISAVMSVCEDDRISKANCLKRAEGFSEEKMIEEYVRLYEEKKN